MNKQIVISVNSNNLMVAEGNAGNKNISDIPYTKARPHAECVELMLADIKINRGFVLSAVTGDFSDKIEALYDLAVYIEAP